MTGPFTAVISPEAAVEIARITAWWHDHRHSAPGLFQLEFEQAVAKIVLRRTGYVVLYSVDLDAAEIAVLRVRHGKRRPLTRLKRK